MRLVIVGCEYSGVTTLIDSISQWGLTRGFTHHLDDHFAIPDAYHLDEAEQRGMLEMLPAIKARFQLAYHVRLMHQYDHILLGGFHIEEAVYGPRYYYEGIDLDVREFEPEMPADTILVHLYAAASVIRERMRVAPHRHQVVRADDVELVLDHFAIEVDRSWIRRSLAIDTSELTPERLLATFLERSVPQLNSRDALFRLREGAPSGARP